MDKTTKLLIRVACVIIIFTGITITAPFVDRFLACLLFDSNKCSNVPFMKWKYLKVPEIKEIIMPYKK